MSARASLRMRFEEAPRCADRRERAWFVQRLRHDRDRGGVANRRGVARCAAGLSRCEPRSVRQADRSRGARRALDAARRHLSGVGRFFRDRPARPKTSRRASPSARAFMQAPASNSGRAATTGYASTLPRRGRSSRTRSAGWTTRLPISADERKPSEPEAMKRPVIGVIANTHLIENRFTAHLVGENNLARGGRRHRRIADDVRRLVRTSPSRRAAGGGRRRAADRRPRQRSSQPLRHRAASEARALRPAARRLGARTGRSLRRARRAAARDLPRLSGDERRVRRLAASRDPRAARTREPSDATAGDWRNPSGSRRHFRRPS